QAGRWAGSFELRQFLVHLNLHRLGDCACGLSGSGCGRRLHEGLGLGFARSQLNEAPVRRVAARRSVVAAGGLGSAPDADAHHYAATPPPPPAAATGDGDVLEYLLARLRVIHALGVDPRSVTDDVGALPQRTAHGVPPDPFWKEVQLALDVC